MCTAACVQEPPQTTRESCISSGYLPFSLPLLEIADYDVNTSVWDRFLVFQFVIEHLEQQSGHSSTRLEPRLVLGNIAVFAEYLVKTRRTVSNGPTGRIWVTVSPLCVCVSLRMWVSEDVRLCTTHLSTSGCTDCVWLSNNWVRLTSKTHTVWAQPEDREHTHVSKASDGPQGPQVSNPAASYSWSVPPLLPL